MRIPWSRTAAAVLAAIALLAFAVRAEQTRRWRQSAYEEFLKGTPKGIALRSDGGLELAPRFATFAEADASYLWALRLDSQGRLYAAGGSPARAFRFDAAGKPTTVFESGELSAQALAIDAADNLYIATNPDGKVYRVTPQGAKSVFFEPKTKYIWDLALAPDGTLYVATGDKGQIFAVSLDGKGDVFYATDEIHIRALALDGKGHLLAGTEPSGRILRLTLTGPVSKTSPKSAAGREAFVLYETPKREVTAISLDAKGNLYAAAIGEKQRVAPGVVTAPGVTLQPALTTGLAVIGAPGVVGVPQPTAFVPFPPFISSALYRIAPDGAPEELWASRDDLVYAVGFSRESNLLLGTGNTGSILEVESRGIFSNLAKSGSSQVTAIARAPDGKTYFATANPGRIVTLASEHEAEGTYESKSFDAQLFSEWGSLEWWGGAASATVRGSGGGAKPRVEFYVRSGNTSDPGKEWSPWSGPYTSPGGDRAQCPPARFVQWKVVMRDGRPGDRIDWVSLAYLPRNVAPVIDAIVLQDPGVRVQGATAAPAPNVPAPVTLKFPPSPAVAQPGFTVMPPAGEKKPPRVEAPPQGFAQKGYRSVLWSAHDDNDDDLLSAIYYRGEGEQEWKLLKDKLEQKFYSWDTTTMPDGAYYLKIATFDAPSNPPALALTAERSSDRFEVDNTPPVLEGLAAENVAGRNPAMRVRWSASDATSAIERAEYSLDAGDWTLVYPLGGLSDARRENYEVALPGPSPGEHTLAVRVADRYDNLASGKVTFVVSAAKR